MSAHFTPVLIPLRRVERVLPRSPGPGLSQCIVSRRGIHGGNQHIPGVRYADTVEGTPASDDLRNLGRRANVRPQRYDPADLGLRNTSASATTSAEKRRTVWPTLWRSEL